MLYHDRSALIAHCKINFSWRFSCGTTLCSSHVVTSASICSLDFEIQRSVVIATATCMHRCTPFHSDDNIEEQSEQRSMAQACADARGGNNHHCHCVGTEDAPVRAWAGTRRTTARDLALGACSRNLLVRYAFVMPPILRTKGVHLVKLLETCIKFFVVRCKGGVRGGGVW
jgi:hypothetical protein